MSPFLLPLLMIVIFRMGAIIAITIITAAIAIIIVTNISIIINVVSRMTSAPRGTHVRARHCRR